MLALEGVKVLDLTMVIPGQFCTMLLADMGAEVIKVERYIPEEFIPKPILDRLRATRRLDRNKKSIGLNLKSKEGLQLFHKLAKGADVIFEGYRPQVTKGMGIDYDTIKEMNPRIVYCSLSGFGQDGPYVNLPGFDLSYIATAGVLDVIQDKNGFPVIPSNFIGDIAGGGSLAALGITMALLARERTGKGQYIDIGIADGAVAIMSQAFAMHWFDRENSITSDTVHIEKQADYGVYETKGGGYVSIAAIIPQFWTSLCKAVGHEELIFDQGNVEKRQEIRKVLEEVFRTKTRDEWFDILTQCDVPVAKVNDLDEAAECPQYIHRKMIVEMENPVSKKREKHVGIPIKLSDTPGSLRTYPPSTGQHTDEILRNMGLSASEISKLRETKVIH